MICDSEWVSYCSLLFVRLYSQAHSAHHGDLALDDITSMRQDGKDGGRVQKPIDHVDDPVGRNDVGARQVDALLTQQDLTLEREEGRSTRC